LAHNIMEVTKVLFHITTSNPDFPHRIPWMKTNQLRQVIIE
jgi:hypothetical protein